MELKLKTKKQARVSGHTIPLHHFDSKGSWKNRAERDLKRSKSTHPTLKPGSTYLLIPNSLDCSQRPPSMEMPCPSSAICSTLHQHMSKTGQASVRQLFLLLQWGHHDFQAFLMIHFREGSLQITTCFCPGIFGKINTGVCCSIVLEF